MGDLIAYRGYTIEAKSYRVLEPDGWIARAELTREEPGDLRMVGVDDAKSRRFPTKDEADGLAFQLARVWVDERG
jgi:hypothetical protein